MASASAPRSRTSRACAGVHPGTVSRALNAETRRWSTRRPPSGCSRRPSELGYRPNPIARGLKTSRSYTVGVLIPDLTNPLFPPIVRGIQDRLEEAGYTPLIANTDNDPERERADFEAMRARQVDGLITATARRDHGLPAGLADLDLPVVLVNRRLEDGACPSVVGDDREGRGWRSSTWSRSATGGSPISPVRRSSRPGACGSRASSAAMAAAGIEPDPELVLVRRGVRRERGRAAVQRAAGRASSG